LETTPVDANDYGQGSWVLAGPSCSVSTARQEPRACEVAEAPQLPEFADAFRCDHCPPCGGQPKQNECLRISDDECVFLEQIRGSVSHPCRKRSRRSVHLISLSITIRDRPREVAKAARPIAAHHSPDPYSAPSWLPGQTVVLGWFQTCNAQRRDRPPIPPGIGPRSATATGDERTSESDRWYGCLAPLPARGARTVR
jgi:hypothetical protein